MASRFKERLLGLHAYAELPWHTGLCLRPCKAIHTAGLTYAIDVVFLDCAHQVVKQLSSVPSWKIAVCLRAAYVVELPAGYCAAYPNYADLIAKAVAYHGHLRETPILPSSRR
jgi:uncharacterized membrane protein (UPF0127 family)